MTLDATRQAMEFQPAETDAAERPLVRSMLRGLVCRCPRCGKGKLFRGYLTAVPQCESCGQAYEGLHRADDLPPYLTIFVIGHIVVALYMALDEAVAVSLAVGLGIFIPMTLLMSLALLRPMKGLTIGLQWAMRMHGFGHSGDAADH